ncbi:AAA family ATPase [Defluviimonas salinarum]|uniref:AAA family ATPase n=1 Tax=Defluviimonas salinarum TaxID=2992147 RepID=A0ABT3J5C8_9RHOB|nr:AAA family ATPase [Defluviimonas salinarum]MCW3782899.1 AAA family ATPase [Defluviimonas salinarum]
MQILAIRGQNLASLADSFEIDLTCEPLRSAGLFAITGETGSGKSTILDAMCLALYGDCPRLSIGGVNDDVPDSGGEAIKSRDARAILRRGATAGSAEVDFLAPDGISYRASWGARRARGRADGRLQNVDRSLMRIEDGQVLETQINTVNARIAGLTGLTYDEFRRTVLLAQGDFDAFLRANTADRAALLEKVTGTGIYREISKRIFERHEAARAVLATLEARRGEHRIMSDAERAELGRESADLERQAAEAASLLRALGADLQRHREIAEAERRKAGAAEADRKARDAQGAAEPDRRLLARLETALPLGSDHERVQAAVRALKEADAAVTRAADAEVKAASCVTDTEKAWNAAMTAHREAEEAFKAFGPVWSKATALDGRIRDAGAEALTAAQSLEAAEKRRKATELALTGLDADLNQAEAARRSVLEKLEEAPGAGDLAASWETVRTRIGERVDLRAAEKAARGKAASDLAEAGVKKAGIEGLDALDAKDRATIAGLEEEAGKEGARLVDIERDDPQDRMSRLVEAVAGVKEMSRAADELESATGDLGRAEAARGKAAGEFEAATGVEETASREIDRATAAVTALAEPVDRAEAAVSEAAQRLRRQLADGEPCPVCGSLDHPVHSDDALAGMARDLRARLDLERRALETARQAQTEARGAAAAARAGVVRAKETIEAARLRQDAARVAWSEAAGGIAKTRLADLLPAGPEGAREALGSLLARLEIRRGEIQALIGEAAGLRRSIEARRSGAGGLSRTIEERARQREGEAGAIAGLERSAALAAQEAENAVRRIAAIDLEIAPALGAGGHAPSDLDADAVALGAKLQAIVDRWRRLSADLKDLDGKIADLKPRIGVLKATLSGQADAVEEMARANKTRQDALEALKLERAGLLGGEATDAHRSRWNETRLAAQTAKDDSAGALSEAKSRASAAVERVTSAREQQEKAALARDEAERVLHGKLSEAGLDADELAGLLARGSGEAARLRAGLKALDDAVTTAAAALAQRAEDLVAAREAGVPEKDAATLEAEAATAETAQSARRERIGAIAGQVAGDDATRARLAGLEAEILTARGECDTWAAVNEAVGSRSGGKFAQIAQGVTLAMLVERANQHLADLKPRYRLVQGGEDLALHVIDRDMGDEIRSTRSLSGGERFLVSLALALALSRMGSHGGLAATLFIDEGFGSLDAESLDIAIDALETLQSQGRTIGVISHVEAMKDRIPVQVRVQRQGGGSSGVSVRLAA